MLHMSHIDAMVSVDDPLPETPAHPLTDIELRIGQHIAGIVEDGATLQMGIGAIPDAALAALSGHKDLGIHSEMFSDGVVDLVEKGVITGSRKKTHQALLLQASLSVPAGFLILLMTIRLLRCSLQIMSTIPGKSGKIRRRQQSTAPLKLT